MRILRWVAIILGGVIAFLLLGVGVLYAVSERRLDRTYEVEPEPVALPSDSAVIEHGRHLAEIRGCMGCHGRDMGGDVFIDFGPLAKLSADNLTAGRGGVGRSYTDDDWVRAIRHGIGPDGKPLLFMPSHEYNVLSDSDLGALIAYIRQLPAVNSDLPDNSVGPLGRFLYLTGKLPLVPAELIDHDAPRADPPERGVTAAYGAYLATGCTGCHGNGLSGGPIPGAPPGTPVPTNITPDPETGIGSWSEADFFRALREGKRPDGTAIDPFMPWQTTAKMSDDEIRAMWLHVRSVAPRREGNR